MAKVTAPLLSFGARGQIGKSIVAASWRGIAYMRQHVVPANPQTASQTQTRSVMKWLTQVWKLSSTDAQAPFVANAKGQPYTGINKWIQSNLATLRGATGSPPSNLAGIVGSPGANGGLVAAALVLTDGGTHHAVATLTAPTLPTGWSIDHATAVAWKDTSPETDTDFNSYSATDSSNPYAPSIALPAAGTYRVAAWFVYLKPDGTLAYGPSLQNTVVIA